MLRWVGAALFVLAGGIGLLMAGKIPTAAYSYHGSVMNPAFNAPEVQLTDIQGKTFSLSAQDGSPVLLYFGYTNCPDECPLAMATYSQVIQGLGKQASTVRFVFVTVDPARDTPQAIGNFLSHFNSQIIGLTGTQAQLQAAWQGYGVYAQGSASGKGVDHSDQIFLIDPKGQVRVIYPHDIAAAQLLADVQHVLKGG
jgi:protein SCO1/2